MAVSEKGRRKIICDNQKYLWYIDKDNESYNELVLHIISIDKQIILAYPLNTVTPYVISKGNKFQQTISDGCWKRCLVPIEQVTVITPKFVSELISWAVNGENAVEVKWNGKDINL